MVTQPGHVPSIRSCEGLPVPGRYGRSFDRVARAARRRGHASTVTTPGVLLTTCIEAGANRPAACFIVTELGPLPTARGSATLLPLAYPTQISSSLGSCLEPCAGQASPCPIGPTYRHCSCSAQVVYMPWQDIPTPCPSLPGMAELGKAKCKEAVEAAVLNTRKRKQESNDTPSKATTVMTASCDDSATSTMAAVVCTGCALRQKGSGPRPGQASLCGG